MNLTDRQIQILKVLIKEYIETAKAIGSDTLEKKYNLGFSPATIRNEMVKLTKKGFLKQFHKSAGRIPTPMALKYYVHNILKTETLPVSEEVSVKQKVWDYRHELNNLLKETAKVLAEKSKALALVTTEKGDFYHAGTANILDFPEFYDIDLTKTLLSLLDRFDYWQTIFNRPVEKENFYLLLGDELGKNLFNSCGFLYTKFNSSNNSGTVGIVGPYRLNYGKLIPMIKYFGDLLSEIV